MYMAMSEVEAEVLQLPGMDDERAMQIRESVARGVRLLDKARDGWWRRIDLDDLAMDDCMSCVLGQLFGDYCDGTNILEAEMGMAPGTIRKSAEKWGFDIDAEMEDIIREELYDEGLDDEEAAGVTTNAETLYWSAVIRCRQERGGL